MDEFMQAAIDEARKVAEGGIPIGSVIVHRGQIIGRGHNQRIQQGSVIRHGEMDAWKTPAGSNRGSIRRRCFTPPLSPCDVQRGYPALRHFRK